MNRLASCCLYFWPAIHYAVILVRALSPLLQLEFYQPIYCRTFH